MRHTTYSKRVSAVCVPACWILSTAGCSDAWAARSPFLTPSSPRPRRYLTVGEYNGINSYMRGRLTLDKINACLDEVVAHCEATAKLMAAAKAGGLRGSAEERKAASELFHNLQMKEPCRRVVVLFSSKRVVAWRWAGTSVVHAS